MYLRKAQHNTAYQQLSLNADVQAIVDLLRKEIEARGPISAFLRDQAGKRPANFQEALRRLSVSLTPIFPGTMIKHIILTMRNLYERAMNDDDANKRRGFVLEMVVYAQISDYYTPQECMMQCDVYRHDDLTKRINTEELDVCAWNSDTNIGEAYECKTHPVSLTPDDCSNLIGVADACTVITNAFRIGAVSYESRGKVAKQLRNLGVNDRILPIGWNNLDDLSFEPEPFEEKELE